MRTTFSALTMTFLMAAGVAQAADLGPGGQRGGHLRQAPPPMTGPALRQFYVRADIGIARHAFDQFAQQDLADNGGAFLSTSIGDVPVVGMGFGWQVNRFRFDLTGEYRATARVKALDGLSATLVGPDGTLVANTAYDANMSAVVGLMNGYFDLGTWRGVTPYVGAGIGFSRIQMSDLTTLSTATFTDSATGATTTQITPGTAGDKTEINLAWALMAGLSFDVGTHAKLDLGYRYLNLGGNLSASSGLIDCVCGTTGQPLKISGLESHEIRIGLRVPLGGDVAPAHHPMK